MRFYKIQILNDDGSVFQIAGQSMSWTSLSIDGKTPDPGALNIECDIPYFLYDGALGAAYVRIWGIGLQLISQASMLNGKKITVSLGMSLGLPLANPSQQGTAFQGRIFQAFGNWVLTNQTLDIVFYGDTGGPVTPINLAGTWTAGTALSDALQSILSAAFPGAKINIAISSNLKLTNDQPFVYQSLSQFAQWIKPISLSINKTAGYLGVSITYQNGVVNVFDGTVATNVGSASAAGTSAGSGAGSSQSNPFAILYNDLVGQPTWIDLGTVQVQTIMRGDLQGGMFVTLPPSIQTVSAASQTQARTGVSFSGTYLISGIRQVGNFRARGAQSWVAVLTLVALPSMSGTTTT